MAQRSQLAQPAQRVQAPLSAAGDLRRGPGWWPGPWPRRRPGKWASPGQQGFSLIELLVTLAITVIGLTGLMSLHVAVMKGNEVAARNSEATTIAQESIEELRSMSLAKMVTTYSPLPINDTMATVEGRGGLVYERNLEVEVVSGNLIKIRVEVVWADGGADPSTAPPELVHMLPVEFIRTTKEAP